MLHCRMVGNSAWLWLLVAFVAAGVAAWFALDHLRRAARRRKRRAYYTSAGYETAPQQLASRPAPLSSSMTPERAAAIREQAERSAQGDWAAGVQTAMNRYDHGTPEHVLWYASYQLHMGELAEHAAAEAGRGHEHEQREPPAPPQ